MCSVFNFSKFHLFLLKGTQFSPFVGVFIFSAVVYSGLFWKVLVPQFEGLSKSDAWKSFSTSIIGPCIVGDPGSRFIFFSYLISVLGFICFQGIVSDYFAESILSQLSHSCTFIKYIFNSFLLSELLLNKMLLNMYSIIVRTLISLINIGLHLFFLRKYSRPYTVISDPTFIYF